MSPLHHDAICLIVVTYHPDDTVIRQIKANATLSRYTIVVDNGSPAHCLEALRELDTARVYLLRNPRNEGIAAALNTGIRQAIASGHTWFLLLDQDTTLFETTISTLISAYREAQETLGRRVALLGSNYFQQCADGSIREARVRYTAGRTWHEVNHTITAGSLLGLDTFNAVGPFREEFFIDHVDHEYCLRAQRQGLAVIQTAQPIMAHRIGLQVQRRIWFKFGAKVSLNGYSPLRRYYQHRNFQILAKEFEHDFPDLIAELRHHFRKDAKRALFYEGRFLANLRALLLARQHGRLGILGPALDF